MSNLQTRVQKLEASAGTDPEAQARAAVEKFAPKVGIDLAKPGIREFLEKEARAGRITPDGTTLWEHFARMVETLHELERGW
jgi:hypothetical protein